MITYLFSRLFEQYFFSQPVLHFFLPLAATSAITYLSFYINRGPSSFKKTYIIHIQARRKISGWMGFFGSYLNPIQTGRGHYAYHIIGISQPLFKPFRRAWVIPQCRIGCNVLCRYSGVTISDCVISVIGPWTWLFLSCNHFCFHQKTIDQTHY